LQPKQKCEILSKITITKRATGGTQVVEHLLGQHEALNSNPNTAKKVKNKKIIYFTMLYTSISAMNRNIKVQILNEILVNLMLPGN
jgi:hypothetical protein